MKISTPIPYYIYSFLMVLAAIMGTHLPAQAQADGLAPTPIYTKAPKREMRAVWVTTLGGLDWPRQKATSPAGRERQKRELCTLLDQLKAANINTVLLQARIRGSVIYPSDIEPWDVALTGQYGTSPGYDPLQFAIEETHRRGMELHAWIVTIPCFKQSAARQMGPKSIVQTHPELCVKHADMYYLDPGMPGTADYLAQICREVVSRYDIDGLHFDYIRYPENAGAFADGATYKRYGGSTPKATWRRNNISHIVRRIYNETKAAKPWVKVSCSPVGKHADLSRFSSRGWNARDAVHQDAEEWLREGIHDILFPMTYFDGNHFYPFVADWLEQRAGRQVAPGLGIYFMSPSEKNWPLATIRRQLYYLRRQGLDGQSYFRSAFLTDNVKGLYDFLRTDFYAYPALTPACPWLDDTPPTPPQDMAIRHTATDTDELTWEPSTDDQQGGVRYNVYASTEWPVDASRAENLVATALTQPRYAFHHKYVRQRRLHLAVTAMDRCGNESTATQASHPQATAGYDFRLLEHDGATLRLPRSEAYQVLITDEAGRTLWRYRANKDISIAWLQPGLYKVWTLTKSPKTGNVYRRWAGDFIK